MFEHFTFGAQAQTTLFHPEDIIISASPTDTSFPLLSSTQTPTSYFPSVPGQKGGMNDIVHAFSQQTLYPDESPTRSIWTSSFPSPDFSVDSSIDDEFTPDEMSYISTTRGMTTLQSSISSTHSLSSLPLPHPRIGTLACRRLQRQLNVQLQSYKSHIKDINSLVEDMISTNSQCRLHTTKSSAHLSSSYNIHTPPSSRVIPSPSSKDQDLLLDTTEEHFMNGNISPDEDEGFVEGDDNEMDVFALSVLEEEMSLRRASTPSGIRKYSAVKWKSVEYIGSTTTLARTKVRSVPRMRRRRKVESVLE